VMQHGRIYIDRASIARDDGLAVHHALTPGE
jgi:hypothetical protein